MTNLTPKVWNKKDPNCPKGSNVSYVGRPSKYGNPFVMGGFMKTTREEVIDLYGKWLERQIEQGNLSIEGIKRDLGGKDLVCWCAPEGCHADVLLRIANDL